MTAGLEGGEWSTARPGRTLPPGKTRYPLYRRLGGSQGRSGWAENLVPTGIPFRSQLLYGATRPTYTRFLLKVSGLTTVHEVDKAYGVLTLIVFSTVPFRSYTLRPTFLPLLETFCELLFRDV